MKFFSFLRARTGKRSLMDFIRLVLAFYGCLMLLALYQQLRLFEQGVLDSFMNQNLLLLALHHLGFTALLALVLAFVFNFLENRKPGWGFRVAAAALMAGLLQEFLLTEYFIIRYETPGIGAYGEFPKVFSGTYLALLVLLALVILGSSFRLFYRLGHRLKRLLGGMYPFTIILFSLFLATLMSEKKPVNLNKTQYLLEACYLSWTDSDPYQGADPFPLYRPWNPKDDLGPYLNWPDQPPHIILIAVEGLSAEFVGERAAFRTFAPFIDSLSRQGLYWRHFLSNVRESQAAIPLITGSLPFGQAGFTANQEMPSRYTLFSLLKKNGYRTSFQYGGNASLPGWDRLLFEERVDEVADRKAFGASYRQQDPDRAGNSPGYPDQALFDRYMHTRTPGTGPRFDVFKTLSSAKPNLFPEVESYLKRAETLFETGEFPSREARLIRKNMDFMASMLYTDQQLEQFIKAYSKRPDFNHTILILTGTHHPAGLSSDNPLQSYRVPLIVYSPMLRKKAVFDQLASHLDIAPSLLGSLAGHYPIQLPDRAAWMGSGWLGNQGDGTREIPLYSSSGPLRNLVVGSSLISGRNCYQAGPDMALLAPGRLQDDTLKLRLKRFRAVNRYVVEQQALIPEGAAPFGRLFPGPDKKDMVWIQSVFNGTDFDDAYSTARELALEASYDRASLLCKYILSQVPGHVDTEILLGRIYAWQGDYGKAAEVLEQVVQKYPVYADGYSALLDVYFWSGQDQKALYLKPAIEEHLESNSEVRGKLSRSAGKLLSEAEATLPESLRTYAGSELTQNNFE